MIDTKVWVALLVHTFVLIAAIAVFGFETTMIVYGTYHLAMHVFGTLLTLNLDRKLKEYL